MRKIEHQISLFSILSISIFGGALLMPFPVYAQDQTDSMVEFLFIQHAESGSISRINSTTYSLQLGDLSDRTVLFSNRPDRIVATQSIQDFIGNWTSAQDSFQVDPPNAALVILDSGQKEDIFEIELFNPKYEKDEKILRYDITFLGNATVPDLPDKLGKSVLIIDGGGIISLVASGAQDVYLTGK